jgi:hypothetical protein
MFKCVTIILCVFLIFSCSINNKGEELKGVEIYVDDNVGFDPQLLIDFMRQHPSWKPTHILYSGRDSFIVWGVLKKSIIFNDTKANDNHISVKTYNF